MTQTRLLTTAALALVIGAGAAYAQTNQASPERAPAAQQGTPPDKIAPPINAGEGKRGLPETTGQGSPRSGAGNTDSPRAGEGTSPRPVQPGGAATQGRSGSAAEGTRSGATPESGVKDDKPGTSAGKPESSPKSGSTSSDTKSGTSTTTGASDTKSGTTPDTKSSATPSSPSSTSGQASAGARVNLTTEQRTKITSVIKQQKVEPVNLNISIRVGTRVPEHVRYYPLPAEVVTIYPQWRGFDYIIVGSTIVVIDPATREIVAVLEA